MALLRSLAALSLLSLFATPALSQTCTTRPAGQLVDDPSFEGVDALDWGLGDGVLVTGPTYIPHSGSQAVLMSASYYKTADTAAIDTDTYVQQNIGATRLMTFTVKAFYNVISLSKGASCPDTALPLGTCKLEFTYAFQNIKTITLTSTTGYIEFSTPFLTETGGRSIQIFLSCKPAAPFASCAEAQVLLDDVTFTDPGWDCSWIPWGCFTDSTSFRALPAHGILHNWPLTTTVEACADACHNQGFTYAGLEYGVECWCGNGISSSPATEGCDMPCSGNPAQICGGPDRLSVYHKIGIAKA